ncbi:hypothetical protein [Mycolicibacterium palauense]|uniref:hypothetical protein n=1 Tax=Mycolicibacterium palauense TaxID=2034511 RepID=UPI000BFF17A0|nr:hypothetical protein [Mycolicibacterium palauense]
MSATILRSRPVLDPVEAMRLRDNFELAVGNDGTVIVDLTGVQDLSGAGLAAVTSIVARGSRTGIPIRVLLPPEDSDAARIIGRADLWRFLRPGGVWNPLPPLTVSSHSGDDSRSARPGRLRAVQRAFRGGGDRALVPA